MTQLSLLGLSGSLRRASNSTAVLRGLQGGYDWLLRRIDRWAWLGLTAALLWWHAGNSGVRAFAVDERPWTWTSHLTSFYFQRGAALSEALRRELRRSEPRPAPGTRFFFATLPPWAGFQMGSGALVRDLYRDTTLASYFYSQFSDTTAGSHPCRFLYWDGARLAPLYGANHDPWFQVGSDLLLFDRPVVRLELPVEQEHDGASGDNQCGNNEIPGIEVKPKERIAIGAGARHDVQQDLP